MNQSISHSELRRPEAERQIREGVKSPCSVFLTTALCCLYFLVKLKRRKIWETLLLILFVSVIQTVGRFQIFFSFPYTEFKKQRKKKKCQKLITGKNYSLLNQLLLCQTLGIFVWFVIQLMNSATQPGSVWKHNACSKGDWPLGTSPLMPSGPYVAINTFSSFFFTRIIRAHFG